MSAQRSCACQTACSGRDARARAVYWRATHCWEETRPLQFRWPIGPGVMPGSKTTDATPITCSRLKEPLEDMDSGRLRNRRLGRIQLLYWVLDAGHFVLR